MALLTEQQLDEVTAEFMRQAKGPLGLLKMEIRAAVQPLDAWYDANASSANQALPQPARTVLTLEDKALMSNLIVNKRYLRDVAP